MKKIFVTIALLFTCLSYAQNDSVTRSLNENYPSYQRYNAHEYQGVWPEQSSGMTIFIVSLLSLIILVLTVIVIRKAKGYGSTMVINGFARGARGVTPIYSSSSVKYSRRRGSRGGVKGIGTGYSGGGFGGAW